MSSDTAAARSERQDTRQMNDRLVEAIAEAKTTPIELARQLGLSLSELARWSAQPEHAKVIEALARLSDLRAQMLLSQYRANAAVQLIGIASSSDPTELSRKACVDLLNANMNVFDPALAGSRHAPPDAPQRIDPQKILDALESLGRETP